MRFAPGEVKRTWPAYASQWLGLVALAGCVPSRDDAAKDDAALAAAAPQEATRDARAFQPLTEATWLEELRAPADPDAGEAAGSVGVVSVPLGATEPRPVLVAVHGAFDRPEWSCGGFRGVTDAYPFIVCPRGRPTGDGRYAWSSILQLEHAIDRALLALHARFGVYVAPGPMIFAGFSQGAQLGSYVVARRGRDFPRAMLIEGGWDETGSPYLAGNYKASGGERVLLGCSTAGCPARFDPGRLAFTRAGIETRVLDAGPRGHNLNAEVVTELAKMWPWVIEGRR